jgi:KR domain
MSVEEFHDAIRPKVLGTWNLHNTALQQPQLLTFFTFLSSISGVVGQNFQADYAAANVFLDSFACYRRSLGLAACSVDLGVVEDVGYISEREMIAKRLDTDIWTGINDGLLHKILKFSIVQQQGPPLNPNSASQMITRIPVP